MKSEYQKLIISSETTILTAMKVMDEIAKKLLIVYREDKYLGLLSIGDIQRAIINNHKLNSKISSIIRNDYIVASPNQSLDEVKRLMLTIRAEFMPVVNDKLELTHVYFWEELFAKVPKKPLFNFNLPVVIMAGGMGTRLRPLTYVLPKPLIPFNNKSFLEEIFERFHTHGCDSFYISVNYKADLIEYYLRQQQLTYNISFFREEKPMGTGGSLALLKGKISETFFVSNCDILIDQDYSEVLKYHRDNNNEITVIAALKHFPISYGTLVSGENGQLLEMNEKPELTLKINSGMYILEPHLLNEIPMNIVFHITELIESVIARKGKVGVFPVSEKSWKDIGEFKEYLKLIDQGNF